MKIMSCHDLIDFANGNSLSCEATEDTLFNWAPPPFGDWVATSISAFLGVVEPPQFPPPPPPPPPLAIPAPTLNPKHLEKILYKHVKNQNAHGKQTNTTPATGIQDEVSDSGRSMYAPRHTPPANKEMNKRHVTSHMNARPELGSDTGICLYQCIRCRNFE